MNPPPIVVIGAGVAGLRAAVQLQRSGHSVTVLEARDRLGGRLLSPAIDGGAIDLGATWFWPNESRVLQLVAEMELSSFPQRLAGDMLFQNGTVQRMSGNQLDVPSGRLVGGMASIASALAERLEPGTVHLSDPVSSVTPSDNGLVVTSSADEIEASHVVVAVPPALAVSVIDFAQTAPGGLSEQAAAVAAATPVWMGATTKVVAVFAEPFWRERGLAGSAFSYDGPMREIHDMSGPHGQPAALFGFCSVPPNDDAPTVEAVKAQLVELFGDDAPHPTEVHIADWRREAHTTPPEALGLSNYQTYGHAVFQRAAMGGRLHWASTETSIDAPGHVEGALAAADRAVAAITEALAHPIEHQTHQDTDRADQTKDRP